jgi:hypothetical protein
MSANSVDSVMNYDLEIWGSTAFVSSERTDARLSFSTPCLEICIPGSSITAPTKRELFSFVTRLPKHIDAIKKKLVKSRAKRRHQHVDWRLGNCTVNLPPNGNVERIVAQFTDLMRKIGSLVALAEVICEQTERQPLKTCPSVRFFGCNHQKIDGMEVEQWLAIRKKAAAKIDPRTAKLGWAYAQTLDPYGIYGDLPGECQQIGRERFARSPDSDVWVSFDDLPIATCKALWKRIEQKKTKARNIYI